MGYVYVEQPGLDTVLKLPARSMPELSGIGSIFMYLDALSGQFLASTNGGPYIPLAGTSSLQASYDGGASIILGANGPVTVTGGTPALVLGGALQGVQPLVGAGHDLQIAGGLAALPSGSGGSVVLRTAAPSSGTTLIDRFKVTADGAEEFEGIPNVTAPAVSPAGTGRLYFDSTLNEFLVSTNGGAYVPLSAGGGVSLNGAYNNGGPGAGRTISAVSGAVQVLSSGADDNDVLQVAKTPAAPQSGAGISVSMGANATGAGISVTVAGSGLAGLFSGGSVSSPGAGSGSERFGQGATAGGAGAVAIGPGANASANGSTALGASTTAGFAGSVAIGAGAATTAVYQLVVGSGTNPVQNVFFGSGPSSFAPAPWTAHGTAAAAASGMPGGSVSVLGGAGDGSGAGGSASFSGGAGGATGAGGPVSLAGGAGGTTSGAGGQVTLAGGTATSGPGGSVSIHGAPGSGAASAGGSVTLSAGASTGAASAGSVGITGGAGSAAPGGPVVIQGGTGSQGGAVTLTAGTGLVAGLGGTLTASGGQGGPTGQGGDIVLAGGLGGGSAPQGGDVILETAPAGSGTTLVERLRLSHDGALDYTGIATASAPAVAAPNHGRVYYDSTVQGFLSSANGGAYQVVVTSSTGGSLDSQNAYLGGATITENLAQGPFTINNPGATPQTALVVTQATAGQLALDVTGDVRFTGKMTLTGSLDPTQVLLSGPDKRFGATDAGPVYLAPFADAVSGVQVRRADDVTVAANFDTSAAGVTLTLGNGVSVASPAAGTIKGSSASAGATTGGSLLIVGGAGSTTGAGGAATLQGGQGGATGNGSNVFLNGGVAGSAAGSGGDVLIQTATTGAGTTLVERLRVTHDGAQDSTGIATSSQPAVSAAGHGRLYYDSTLNEYMISVNGGAYTPVQTGAASLQQAYSNGQTITEQAVGGSVTQTPVTITNSVATSTDVLQLVRTPGATLGGNGLVVTMGANATGAAAVFAGTGPANAAIFVGNGTTSAAPVAGAVNGTSSAAAGVGGGGISVQGGAGSTTGSGGTAALLGGGAGANGVGGLSQVVGGPGGATSGAGGAATLQGGSGTAGNSTGGTATVQGGSGQGTAAGAAATLQGGTGGVSGAGGSVFLNGGIAGAAAGVGGDVVIRTAATGSGTTLLERARVTSAGRVGVGTASPGSTLEVAGSFAPGSVTTTTADVALDATDRYVLVDASGGPVTVQLPAAGGATRRSYKVKKIDTTANVVTVQAAVAETIDGSNTRTLGLPWEGVELVSDGTAWFAF